jgi:hypothetical protein
VNDLLDIAKVNGINFGTVAAVSVVDIELLLKIAVLVLTAIYTAAKICKLYQGEDDD